MSAHLTVHDLLVHATILLVCSSFAAPQPIQKGLNTMEQYYQEKVVEKESYKVVESYLGICGIFPCPLFRVQCDSVHRRQQYRPKWVLCLGGRNLNGLKICRLTVSENSNPEHQSNHVLFINPLTTVSNFKAARSAVTGT
eukprot:scpid96679/ scgid0595/ 